MGNFARLSLWLLNIAMSLDGPVVDDFAYILPIKNGDFPVTYRN
jgi:hypothetical protein